MKNKTTDQLYTRFHFVDEKKRSLEEIRTAIIKFEPAIFELPENTVVPEQFSSYSLWFKDRHRGCRIYYYGYEQHPRYTFFWDETTMFEVSGPDIKNCGRLIRKWVFDKALPADLKAEFDMIDFGKLSEYYEVGNGVQGEFILSWDSIEQFYSSLDLDKKDEVLSLIKTMRKKGFDKMLRVGQSLYTFILSRSRRHGLREDQKSISFSFNFIKTAMEINTGKEKLSFNKIEYNDTIEQLLRALSVEKID
jgi:hypothetical protein